jgi:nitrite reductase/ring-hydroxylating ferredoxin subunit
VQCPWHGSQFDVRTGRVVAGPAQEKIETYAIEVRGGEVYVQPPKREEAEPRKAA